MAGSLKALLQGTLFLMSGKDFRCFSANLQDPFDNYDYIRSMEKKYHFTSKFFFLFGRL